MLKFLFILVAPLYGQAQVQEEFLLKQDRDKLEELRSEIPQELKLKNDEEALILETLKKPGSEARSKWQTLMRKKRQNFNKDASLKRKNFNQQEKTSREEFLKKQKTEREEFLKNKNIDPDKRKSFFAEQETKRKDYFQGLKETRSEFESQMTEERKTFDDYIKERNAVFNDEARARDKELMEQRKMEREKKRIEQSIRSKVLTEKNDAKVSLPQNQDEELMKEFDQMQNIPSVPLTPPKKGK